MNRVLFLFLFFLASLWSCSVHDNGPDGDDVMPLRITGTAMDMTTAAPLKGIKMVFNCYDPQTRGFKVPRQTDTVYTNSRGGFAFDMDIVRGSGDPDLSYVIIASDIDGEENGGTYHQSMMTLEIGWKQAAIFSAETEAYMLGGLAIYMSRER